MEKLIISACLLGTNCKYNGGNNYVNIVEELKKKYELIPICPEVMGGLDIPRISAEIKDGIVINKEGIDVSSYFNKGALMVLDTIKKLNIKYAVLKDGSPSCGSTYIYDGSFNNIKISGMGITAKALYEKGIIIYNENNIGELL